MDSPTNPVARLGHEVDSSGTRLQDNVWVWCPGCEQAHRFAVNPATPDRTPIWGWNGSCVTPSFEPSYLTWWTTTDGTEHRCHSFLRDGVWQFLDDSTHALAGQFVPMVPLPDWIVNWGHNS